MSVAIELIAISPENRGAIAEYLTTVHGGRRSKYFLSADDVLRLAAEAEARLSHPSSSGNGNNAQEGTKARYEPAGRDGSRTPIKATSLTIVRTASGWSVESAKVVKIYPYINAAWHIIRPGRSNFADYIPCSVAIEASRFCTYQISAAA